MKKIIALLLTLVMTFSIVACDTGDNVGSGTDNDNDNNQGGSIFDNLDPDDDETESGDPDNGENGEGGEDNTEPDDPKEPEHTHAYEYVLISYNEGFALEGHCTNTNCDEPTIITDEGLVPQHEYSAPTCVSGGYSRWTYVKDGHDYILTIDFPSVSDNHYYEDGKCSYCGAEDPNKPVDPEQPEHTHSWIQATCTDPMTCSTCGEISGEAKGHSWQQATCTTPKICSSCGEISGSALGHEWTPATCTTPKTCTTCGETNGSANGHAWVDPTCTTPKSCSTCGTVGGSALGHSWTPATCTTAETCTTCGKTSGNALGHSFSEGKCSTCGASDPEYIDPNNPDNELAVFNALFNPENHVSLKLDISKSELKKIQKDYEKYSSMGSKSPIYRMADLIVTITKPDGTVMKWTIDQVGVRMKGNTSRTSFYSDNDGMYNLIHFKISFQETFEDTNYYGSDAITWTDAAARKARKNRTFATLEKIDIRWNKNDDTTYIRESYAYDLYREFGVLAPHTNLASVDVGNDHAGVWLMYEPIDKIFLEKNLPEEALGGDLYKLGWTSEGATFTSFSSYGVEDEDAGKFYVYDLKTNKKTSDHSSLKNFINTIKSSAASKSSIEAILDIENFVNYCAVSYMIGNPDDLRNNYNNSYIYFRADTGKMIVIPYDMDRGLGVNKDWNPSGNGMTKDGPYDKKAYGNGDQRSPLFLKTVCTGGFFINEYTEALKRVDASEMLTNAKFKEAFDTAAALYSKDASPSKTYGNASGHKFRFDINRTCDPGESKNMSFADYLSAKRATLYKAIGDQGNTDNSGSGSGSGSDSGGSGDSGAGINAKPYIMGDMNSWQQNSQYLMSANGDGTFTFTLTKSHVSSSYNRIKFKIFDSYTNMWYGYEIVDPNCSVNPNDISNNSNSNKNIYLASGTYVLTFDANTVTLYIEKVG